ncbi:hypothetical protein RJ55_06342 [Drechmeria coniospora]|nr:hypothetical protein RJ55_06342 [Drechmeria coniospora]
MSRLASPWHWLACGLVVSTCESLASTPRNSTHAPQLSERESVALPLGRPNGRSPFRDILVLGQPSHFRSPPTD